MAREAMYIERKEIKFTKEQYKNGTALARRKELTFNQLLRDLLDNAIKIDGITRSMK